MIRASVDPWIERRIERQRVFDSDLIEVGRFEAGPDDPDFRFSGPPGRYHLVFPRTSVRIQHHGEAAFVTDLNTVTFYSPEDDYRRDVVDRRGDHCIWIAFAAEIVEEVVGRASASSDGSSELRFRYRFGPIDARSFCRSRELYASLGRPDDYESSQIEESAIELLERLVRSSHAARRNLRQRQRSAGVGARRNRRRIFRRVLELLLDEPIDDRRTLAFFAREAGCSPYHLCRVFREEAGVTLHTYRTHLRVRRALELMSSTSLGLSDIAAEVGFASHSHMTAVFRKTTGRTPSSHRPLLRRP